MSSKGSTGGKSRASGKRGPKSGAARAHAGGKARPAPGGGRQLDVGPDRLAGWVTRFAARNDQITAMTPDPTGVMLLGGNGTTARIEVPYPPFSIGHREPIEAVLDHLATIGDIGMVLVRAGAHSVGICRDRYVTVSSTDTHYVQGRTAAGGWSQQRYARRRGNQLDAAHESTIATAQRVLVGHQLQALVLGGDPRGIAAVLEDSRLAALQSLPRREFRDIPEPRRVVLDEVAARSLDVTITIRDA